MENRRSVPRIPIDVWTQIHKNGICHEGRLLDLSTAGARLATDMAVEEDDVVFLDFDPGFGEISGVPSLAVWVKESGGVRQCGLFFIDIDDASLNRLARALDAIENKAEE